MSEHLVIKTLRQTSGTICILIIKKKSLRIIAGHKKPSASAALALKELQSTFPTEVVLYYFDFKQFLCTNKSKTKQKYIFSHVVWFAHTKISAVIFTSIDKKIQSDRLKKPMQTINTYYITFRFILVGWNYNCVYWYT